jgi:hypothetical protein
MPRGATSWPTLRLSSLDQAYFWETTPHYAPSRGFSFNGKIASKQASTTGKSDDIVRFMPADALWTFAMAFNVYLTFFHKYDAARLRSLEWKYVLLCYGIPFIPSFVYFFVRTEAKGPIYGSAVVKFPPRRNSWVPVS